MPEAVRAQDRHQFGSIFWPWKENCASNTTWGVYAGVYPAGKSQHCAYDQPAAAADTAPKAQNGCLRASKERLLARVWPRAAPVGFSYTYNPADGSFSMKGRATGGEVLVYVPPEVRGAASATGGTVQTDALPDGSRLLHFRPAGDYTLAIAPAPLALTGCA